MFIKLTKPTKKVYNQLTCTNDETYMAITLKKWDKTMDCNFIRFGVYQTAVV